MKNGRSIAGKPFKIESLRGEEYVCLDVIEIIIHGLRLSVDECYCNVLHVCGGNIYDTIWTRS